MHINKFYSDLERYLTVEFTESEPTKRDTLMAVCHDSCVSEKIVNMDGIFAFYVLSFMNVAPINVAPEYQIANKRYILLGYNPEQLPVDALEAMY